MRLSLWRPYLIQWLNKHIHIDSWELRSPTQTAEVVGFIPPLQKVSYYGSSGQIRGYAHQELFVTYLYDSSFLYSQLPIADLEGVHSTICQLLMTQWHDIASLTEFEEMAVDAPVSIRESGDSNGSWLIDLHWTFSISWLAEPEYAIGSPYTITSVGIRLYDRQLTQPGLPTDFTADRTLDLTVIQPPTPVLEDADDSLLVDETGEYLRDGR